MRATFLILFCLVAAPASAQRVDWPDVVECEDGAEAPGVLRILVLGEAASPRGESVLVQLEQRARELGPEAVVCRVAQVQAEFVKEPPRDANGRARGRDPKRDDAAARALRFLLLINVQVRRVDRR